MKTIADDPRWMDIAGQGVQIEYQLRKELLTIEAATIERCAQVLDEYFGSAENLLSRRIRALKDKP